MKYFYSHLIEIESIFIGLDKMDLTKTEKLHLAHLIDSSLHHVVCDAILSELHQEDKRAFMVHLNEGNHDKIWQFLNEKIERVEDKIKKAAQDLKNEMHKDLKKARKLK